MPVTRSAKKKVRQDVKRNEVNNRVRKQLRDIIKSVRVSPSVEQLTHAFSILDRSVKKNIIHKNKANRLKSSLSKTLKASPPVESKKPPVKKKTRTTTKKRQASSKA